MKRNRLLVIISVLGVIIIIKACGILMPRNANEQIISERHFKEHDTQTQTCRGMTWSLRQQSGAYSLVGSDKKTDAYHGDTPCFEALPILCLRQTDSIIMPKNIKFTFYQGWAKGEVRITRPILGSDLTSLAVANALCAQTFGPGWRMAEFHDGGGGWHWWAYGEIPANTRFWVYINDQPANPWNSGRR